ncbi:putative bifunctional UDP-N-acetylglucosamine transferase and deubiquitinase ALG13 isoform X3 [Acanthopagrus latus]|uniref:putative bifunctional UDP-N-acetylglucosamine transferase and deubiquitinase ALG13 isoform X3 n=1 Tax=Acanthopagrus latus TaxID=8177 RepID=UPI00187BEE36|nr:putative bifunctional UDP-N-acetylglucosamine transferase and deubiquitinase ALG13 isoform X3 [Acanthopagrus latus]
MKKALNKFYVDMDKYLYSLGLYRKMVARDACSLFRAVSERLYYSQNYHRRVRQHCANFMRANRCKFELFVEGSFEKHLGRVENPNETVGQVEIKALSQLYRCCFLIYDYPGIPAKVISEDNFVVEVMLSHSINGHYDIIYPRTYHASAALRQSLLYELFYTRVFLSEETELCQAMEACRVGGQRYRHSTPEDQAHSREDVESGGAAEETRGAVTEGAKCPLEAPPRARLSLSYKVMRSLDAEYYRDVEFNIRLDTCEEMQKTDYKLFAGRQYLLGDNCQVHLEAIGKYSNAFNQEVETDSTAVTLIIEELRKKHPDLKPVNPVPAWNVAAPTRTGDLDLDSRGGRHHRQCNFRKFHGSSGGPGTEILMPPPSHNAGPAPSALPPRFQPAGHPHPQTPPFPGAMAYHPSAPPHHHPIARPPRYGASSHHLIGPQLTYFHPGSRYHHNYENYTFGRLFPPTDLNPVPAWNVAAPTRNGDLDLDSRGGRHHHHCNFRKIHGGNGGPGTELLMPPPSYYGGPAPSALPPRVQQVGHPHPPPPPGPGAMAHDPSAPPHHHPIARTPDYDASRWDLLSWMFNRLLFPPTDLNPVPAWNVAAPTRNGDLDLDSCGGRHHRHCNFRKIHGSSGGPGTELLMPPPSYYGGPAPSALPPRFQPAGHPHQQTPPFPGAMAYHPSAPPHHHPIARPPRYGASRWDLLSWMFNSRSCHQLAALNKECQFGFSEPMEDLSDMDPAIVCYQLEGGDTVFPLLPKKH